MATEATLFGVLEYLPEFLAFGTSFFEKFRFELGYTMKGLE